MNEIAKKYNLGYFETDEKLKDFAKKYLVVQHSGMYNMFLETREVLKAIDMPVNIETLKMYYDFVFSYEDILKDLGLRK